LTDVNDAAGHGSWLQTMKVLAINSRMN